MIRDPKGTVRILCLLTIFQVLSGLSNREYKINKRLRQHFYFLTLSLLLSLSLFIFFYLLSIYTHTIPRVKAVNRCSCQHNANTHAHVITHTHTQEKKNPLSLLNTRHAGHSSLDINPYKDALGIVQPAARLLLSVTFKTDKGGKSVKVKGVGENAGICRFFFCGDESTVSGLGSNF